MNQVRLLFSLQTMHLEKNITTLIFIPEQKVIEGLNNIKENAPEILDGIEYNCSK
jgi:hypothetical protein